MLIVLAIVIWILTTVGACIVIFKLYQGQLTGDFGAGTAMATIVIAMFGWQIAEDLFNRSDKILEEQCANR